VPGHPINAKNFMAFAAIALTYYVNHLVLYQT